MNKRSIENREELKAMIHEAMTFTEEAKYYYRLSMLLLYLSGFEVKTIAEIYNESPTTLWYWIKKGLNVGIEDLLSKAHTGRKTRLSAEQEQVIGKALEQSPRESGYAFENWDGIILSQYILDKFNVMLAVRQCQRLMRKLGFTKQRPYSISGISDPVARDDYKKN